MNLREITFAAPLLALVVGTSALLRTYKAGAPEPDTHRTLAVAQLPATPAARIDVPSLRAALSRPIVDHVPPGREYRGRRVFVVYEAAGGPQAQQTMLELISAFADTPIDAQGRRHASFNTKAHGLEFRVRDPAHLDVRQGAIVEAFSVAGVPLAVRPMDDDDQDYFEKIADGAIFVGSDR